MIKGYLKISWRNLVKNKVHTFINISGLSVGLACSLLIMLWVQNELSVDAFHQDIQCLFSVCETVYSGNVPQESYATYGFLSRELKRDIPEIEYASGFGYKRKHLLRAGDKKIKFEGAAAGGDFFKMFSYPLLAGKASSALNTVSSLAVSRKVAEAFFGSPQNAIGKPIHYDNKYDLVITAVFEDLPPTVSRPFDFLTNWDLFYKEFPWIQDPDNYGPRTFIKLRTDADPALVSKKLFHYMHKFFKNKSAEGYSAELELQRFDEMYLHSKFKGDKTGGKIAYVRLFSIVAVFILLTACINFMNLTIARSIKRAKEIGVRKVVGASRASLIRQFMFESMLITSISVIFSLVLLIVLLPVFNDVTRKQIGLPFGQLSFWLELLGITLVTGLISGSYPALFLSSFNTVKVLKGTTRFGSGIVLFRKALVVFQFTLSMILIAGTIIVSRQIDYIRSVNLGYNRDNLLFVQLEGNLVSAYPVFRNEVLQMPGVRSITRSVDIPTTIGATDNAIDWEGKDPRLSIEFTYAFVDYNYTNTMKLQLLQGRDFSKDFPNDTTNFIVNETALKTIGYADPIGKRLSFIGKKGKIIGVLKNFQFSSLHDAIPPLILVLNTNETPGYAIIRLQAGKSHEVLAGLESIYKKMNPNFLFSYTFADEEYQKQYDDEQVIGKLSKAFAFLAIFISCLGLLGLVMFAAEQRVKEIGIRKVLGASVSSLFALLLKEFLWLVLIAVLIAVPVAWYFAYQWLQNYTGHTPMQWWVFALAGSLIIVIALLTVSFQAVKVALLNPVKSLRSE